MIVLVLIRRAALGAEGCWGIIQAQADLLQRLTQFLRSKFGMVCALGDRSRSIFLLAGLLSGGRVTLRGVVIPPKDSEHEEILDGAI